MRQIPGRLWIMESLPNTFFKSQKEDLSWQKRTSGHPTQHPSHLLPLLEPQPALSWQLPRLLPSRAPALVGAGAPWHAGAAAVAGLLLLLPAGGLRRAGFLPVGVHTWALLLSLLLVYRAWKGPSPTYTATAKPAWPPDPAFTLMLTGWFGLFNSFLLHPNTVITIIVLCILPLPLTLYLYFTIWKRTT